MHKVSKPKPEEQQRLRVVARDGAELSPATPRAIRKMVETGAATIATDESGKRYAQMQREVGRTVPHA